VSRLPLALARIATFPFVLLLAALPVGFAMEVGKQRTLAVENRTGRPLRVVAVGHARHDPGAFLVAPRTLHPLLPLPALSSHLAVAPGETRRLVYSARQAVVLGLAARTDDGRWHSRLTARPDAGGEPRYVLAEPLEPAAVVVEAALRNDPSRVLAWAILLAGPAGSLVFLRLLRMKARTA